MACLLCTHDTSNERETNQQETNDLQTSEFVFGSYVYDLKMRAKQKHTRAKPPKHKQARNTCILYRNLFQFFVRKAMLKKMTKLPFCYAHDTSDERQTNKQETNDLQTSKFVFGCYV